MLDYVDEDSKSQYIKNYIKQISENVKDRKRTDIVTLEQIVNVNPEYVAHFQESFQIFHNLAKEAYSEIKENAINKI